MRKPAWVEKPVRGWERPAWAWESLRESEKPAWVWNSLRRLGEACIGLESLRES